MKLIIEKMHLSSTFLRASIIASSTSFMYLKILDLKITLETKHLHNQMVGLQSCGGFMAPSLLDFIMVIKNKIVA
jgi:hypothetical protein